MVTEFSAEEMKKFAGLFHFMVNRTEGMYRMVEDWIRESPYPFQQKIIEICDNQGYADFIRPERDIEFEKKYPKAVRFPLRNVEEADDVEQSFDWIIEPLISRGSLSVIVGASGSMKTYAMLHAGLCVGAGKQWLGFTTKQASVLYVDEESGVERISYRIRQIKKGEKLPKKFPFMYSPSPRLNFSNDEHFQLLRDMIVIHKFQLVIIDSMIDVIGDTDENSANAMNPLMMKLSQIAKETKAAIVLIHHTGKDNKFRGSTAIPGGVDLMLYVKKGSDKTLTFSTIKARDVEDDMVFTGRFTFGGLKETFSIVGKGLSQPRQSAGSIAEARIIEFLARNPNSTIQQITAGLQAFEYDYDYLRILVGKMETKEILTNTVGGGKGKTGKFNICE